MAAVLNHPNILCVLSIISQTELTYIISTSIQYTIYYDYNITSNYIKMQIVL